VPHRQLGGTPSACPSHDRRSFPTSPSPSIQGHHQEKHAQRVIVLVEADSVAIKRYTKERDHYNDRYSDLMKAQQKTESQAKNWVSWDE
jgi:hypothetical protein